MKIELREQEKNIKKGKSLNKSLNPKDIVGKNVGKLIFGVENR